MPVENDTMVNVASGLAACSDVEQPLLHSSVNEPFVAGASENSPEEAARHAALPVVSTRTLCRCESEHWPGIL